MQRAGSNWGGGSERANECGLVADLDLARQRRAGLVEEEEVQYILDTYGSAPSNTKPGDICVDTLHTPATLPALTLLLPRAAEHTRSSAARRLRHTGFSGRMRDGRRGVRPGAEPAQGPAMSRIAARTTGQLVRCASSNRYIHTYYYYYYYYVCTYILLLLPPLSRSTCCLPPPAPALSFGALAVTRLLRLAAAAPLHPLGRRGVLRTYVCTASHVREPETSTHRAARHFLQSPSC